MLAILVVTQPEMDLLGTVKKTNPITILFSFLIMHKTYTCGTSSTSNRRGFLAVITPLNLGEKKERTNNSVDDQE